MSNRVEQHKHKKQSSPKKALLRFILFGLIPLLAAGYLFRQEIALLLFDNIVAPTIETGLAESYEPLPNKETKVIVQDAEPFTMLLLGVDQRDNEIGRSDTMIFSVVRPKEKRVLMISIPRDAYVNIRGASEHSRSHDKITHAYAFGGASASVSTIEGLLSQRVDYYATINFKGVENTVDALGGLRLPITEDLVNDDKDHEKFVIPGGQELYNGEDALNYVRYREDAGGDLNRTHRQVEFIRAVTSRMIELGNLTKIPTILDSLGETLKTDMPPSTMTDNAMRFLEHDDNFITSHTLKGTGGKRDDGIWYYNVDEEDLVNVKNEISRWLDPDLPIDSSSTLK
ncbi:LCP family protein required for cell wall assembly [Paenibacillus phyllosphaerae]|uniref:LCP family protein required for cell wall assembly n=1 Tax=Paenibacillus phyllosphaerae TaxID=274593 RepID=A0A7W5AT89_9BACL|nr:LCP family protein [Paenibacillus phyllosphaerae]MBB3108197.1 LCP family protein required for cell wall assembly [Paenibacillus phyllosphaerae]